MFKVRPWLLVAFLCVVSAAGGAGAARKLLEAKYEFLLRLAQMTQCAPKQALEAKRDPGLPVMEIHAEGAGFDSMNEAGVNALRAAAQQSLYYEYGGVIVHNTKTGAYGFSFPSTDYAGDHLGIDDDPASYDEDAKIVGDFHTHPCLPYSHIPGVFSDADLADARITGHVGYMLDLCTGDVHFFDPAVDKADEPTEHDLFELMLGGHHGMAKGHIVGHVPVPGTPLEAPKHHGESK